MILVGRLLANAAPTDLVTWAQRGGCGGALRLLGLGAGSLAYKYFTDATIDGALGATVGLAVGPLLAIACFALSHDTWTMPELTAVVLVGGGINIALALACRLLHPVTGGCARRRYPRGRRAGAPGPGRTARTRRPGPGVAVAGADAV